MEGGAHRRVLSRRATVAAYAVTLALVTPLPAAAEPYSIDVDATTDANGATVQVVEGSQSATPGATGGGCTLRYVSIALDPVNMLPLLHAAIGPPPSPDHRPFHVLCGERYITTVWAIPRAAVAAIAQRVARQLLARVEFPTLEIGVNPTTGLAGLESWYWIDGYDGRPVTAARAEFGISIELEVRVSDVRWEFGDGTTVVAGLGERYPARSSVTHTYERSGAYTVGAGFGYRSRYRVDGGEWTDLEAVPRTAERSYDVREVRSALTR